MNETQSCYCDVYDKSINNNSESKHFISKFHKHKQKYGTVVVKEDEFTKPDIDSVIHVHNHTIKDCRKKFFHSFEYRFVYDMKFTKK